MKSKNEQSRREFLKKTVSTTAGISIGMNAMTAAGALRLQGANDRIRVGFIGLGNRGSQLLNLFMENDDVEVGALCDVYEPYLMRDHERVEKRWLKSGKIPAMNENLGSDVTRYKDFRRLLEQKDIDVVCIAAPDHWHALQCTYACEAGKDVYVEKPLTKTIYEGRTMVEVQKRTGRIVAVGLNRRGSSVYQKLSGEIREGKIGRVMSAGAIYISNMYPDGIGNLPPEDPPPGLDWDMWLGPRAYRPYQYNLAPYYFRWWSDYSSQMGNWGVHYMDVLRWMMGEQAPSRISVHGGKYILSDDRTIPDTMEVLFEFASGRIIKFTINEANGGQGIAGGEVILSGTSGTVVADQNQYTIEPARPGQFQTWERLTEPETFEIKAENQYGDLAISENSTGRLIRNFLDCIKDRQQPWCTLEEGHRSTTFAHLANIALATQQSLDWDPVSERFMNSEKANQMLHYNYRSPWKL